MRSDRNILIAMLLNLFFSILEMAGGMLTGSVAIVSDALHDLGDAASIGVSFFLEKKSKQHADERYTYGYGRYSVLGGALMSLVLLAGSAMVAAGAVQRMMNPVAIHYEGMMLLAVIGIGVNIAAALVTRAGQSLNQKAVNLHMLEDVLGWVVVLAGAVAMRLTGLAIIDPLMSIGVALFLMVNAVRCAREGMEIFLEKAPHGLEAGHIAAALAGVEGVKDVHHIHVWSMDGEHHCATMHLVAADEEAPHVRDAVRGELPRLGIAHAVLEVETADETCADRCCRMEPAQQEGHHHHHHHHHH